MRVFDYADMRKIPRLYGVEYPDYRMTYQDILCFSFSKKKIESSSRKSTK